MTKSRLIPVLAFPFESGGLLPPKRGLDQIGPRLTERKAATPLWKNVLRRIGDWFTNRDVLLGLLLETIFFILLQYLLGQRDVSFIWLLTALSFVLTTLAAKIFLHERVDGVRWGGVALIILGAMLISYSEQSKPKQPQMTTPANREIKAQ